MKIYIVLYLVCSLLLCCKGKPDNAQERQQTIVSQQPVSGSDSPAEEHRIDKYDDGEYCATINYYNPATGNNSTYTLDVEVHNGELVQINWPNGGWLDSSHFSPPEIDEDGYTIFSTYDGKDYEVQLDSKGGCSISGTSPEDDEDELESDGNDEDQEEDSGDIGLDLSFSGYQNKHRKFSKYAATDFRIMGLKLNHNLLNKY